HWFNPLCHLAYHLFSEDLEMACDERTIEPRDAEYRAKYLQTLLDCGISLLTLRFGTLSFGTVGIKRRVERIMSFKKTKGITIAFFAVVCLSLVFFLMTNNAAAAGKPSEDHDDYVHVVIRDGNGNVVESVDVYQPDALSPPEPLPDLPDHGSVSSEDPEKYDALLKIREEILTEGVYRSSGELGDPVFAVCEGEVISSERDGGYGLCVTIKDNDGRIWKYGHCSKLTFEKGDYVSFGDLIAYVGTTGLIEKPGIIISIVK
ncbi:MAG: peptidoglycan DD-metalloendopeptidase family protein, partial [Firmicutes bacterium]|nr:peptidoglycan DD-metalloendopeptidase family protein [Bacillota bacterium]